MKKLFVMLPLAAAVMAAPAMAKMDEMSFERKLEKADTNNDGMISRAEHITLTNKYFTEMDADLDGQLSKNEYETAMKKEKSEWKESKDKSGMKDMDETMEMNKSEEGMGE